VRGPDGKFGEFDAPGATVTLPVQINRDRVIAGTWIDSGGHEHGFLRIP
jgi:hypothetical protein